MFINSQQSQEQRRTKYRFIRDCGFTMEEAQKMRDWTHGHIIATMNAQSNRIRASYEKAVEVTEDGQ